MRRLLWALLLVATVPVAVAEWGLVQAPGSQARQAVVTGAGGLRLEVFRDGDTVRGALILADGLARFAPGTCPTLRVDTRRLVNLAGPEYRCEAKGGRAEFVLGQVKGKAVTSLLLYQLMNGGNAAAYYALQDQGYGQDRFSLRRAQQALEGAVGARIGAR